MNDIWEMSTLWITVWLVLYILIIVIAYSLLSISLTLRNIERNFSAR